MNALQDLRGWISQSVKHLPQKHKDMSSIPGIQAEPLNVVAGLVIPSAGEAETGRVFRASLPTLRAL